MKFVTPSVAEKAFNCPHCTAFTTQHWYELRCNFVKEPPNSLDLELVIAADPASLGKDIQAGEINKKKFLRLAQGDVFTIQDDGKYTSIDLKNAFASKCFNCEKISLWKHTRLIYPETSTVPPPNIDLPSDIAEDYREAGVILRNSPRGAAALLRLAVQKLCKELGEDGKNINKDIASLVKKGLDPRIQKALDSVRVIGNDAVHPGQINLKDNTETATTLFKLINLIADRMISDPKAVDEIYASLPVNKTEAIVKRDAKSSS